MVKATIYCHNDDNIKLHQTTRLFGSIHPRFREGMLLEEICHSRENGNDIFNYSSETSWILCLRGNDRNKKAYLPKVDAPDCFM
jgi:hypothetical protein